MSYNTKERYKRISVIAGSGVARIWCEEGHETKRKLFKVDAKIL